MALPLGVGSAVLGGIQLFGGLAQAFGMGDRPEFAMTDEMRRSAGRAEYMAGMGLLPEERSAAIQGSANQQAGAFRRAQDMGGGNLARSMGGMTAAQGLDFENRLASSDANMRRSNIRYADTFSRESQRLADANTQMQNQYRMAEEQAVGRAIQSGLMNVAGFGNMQAAFRYNPGGVDPNVNVDPGMAKMGMKQPMNLPMAQEFSPVDMGGYGGYMNPYGGMQLPQGFDIFNSSQNFGGVGMQLPQGFDIFNSSQDSGGVGMQMFNIGALSPLYNVFSTPGSIGQ
jgi:hypothetical protein